MRLETLPVEPNNKGSRLSYRCSKLRGRPNMRVFFRKIESLWHGWVGFEKTPWSPLSHACCSYGLSNTRHPFTRPMQGFCFTIGCSHSKIVLTLTGRMKCLSYFSSILISVGKPICFGSLAYPLNASAHHSLTTFPLSFGRRLGLRTGPGPLAYRETRAQELTETLWSNLDSPWYERPILRKSLSRVFSLRSCARDAGHTWPC